MGPSDVETIIESFRKQPVRACLIIMVLLILGVVVAYVTGFLGEKGKQHAGPPKENVIAPPPSKEMRHQAKDSEAPVIKQHTEGDQSPAIISDKVEINYGAPKGKNAKE